MLLKNKVLINQKSASLSNEKLTLLSSPNMVQPSLTCKQKKKTIKNQYQWEFGAVFTVLWFESGGKWADVEFRPRYHQLLIY